MALPIPTDGQQLLRQLVKDVDRLKRTSGTQTTSGGTSVVDTETIVLPGDDPTIDGITFTQDVEMSEDEGSVGQQQDDGQSTLTPEQLWVVTPSPPIITSVAQSVSVLWDGLGAGDEKVPPGNFGVLEIHRDLDEFFDVDPAGSTLVGVMTYPGTVVFSNQMYDVPYYYRFMIVTSDRRRSDQSDAVVGTAVLIGTGDIDGSVFVDIDASINQSIDEALVPVNESIATAQDTADNAIASYAPEYAVSSSQTVAPTTGWSTTSPVRTPGTYIWYRTTVTYGNGATSTTSPALLTGNDGAPGTPGTPAAVITLTATTQILAVPAGGGATTPATSVVTGVATNTTITAWLYSVDGAAFSATVPPGVSRTGNAVTITGSTMTAKTIAVRMTDAGTVSDTLTVAKVTDGAGGTPGTPGTPGADGMTILLSNEAQTFAAGTTNAQAGTATTTVIAYKGSVQQTATVGTITGGATGITAAVTNNGTTAPLITFTVTTALVTANGTFTIPVTSGGITVNQVFSWSLSFSGAAGAPGAPAAVVTLNATTQVLTSPAGGGATNPTTSVVTGTTANTTITVWEYSVDGAAFSATVPAGTSRTGNAVTITGSTMTAKTLTVRMADAAGVADTMTVAKVSDGAAGGAGTPGTPGADAYTVLLSNEAQTFAAGTTNAQAGSATSTVIAYKGTVAQTATIGTITGGATGITAAVTNNGTTAPLITFTVTTALATANGTFTIPVTVGGMTFNQVFSWSLSFSGAAGAPGAPGTPAAVITLNTTTQVLTSPAAGGATTPATAVVTGTALNTTITAWTYSVDGAAFSATVPAGVGRTGNVVTITGSTMTAKTITVQMADAASVADTMTVAKVFDGATGGTGGTGGTGPAGADAYTVLLTNEAQVFPGTVAAAIAGSATTSVLAYKATTAQTATIGTITGQVTGLTTAITNNGTTSPLVTITVTTALTTGGTLTIPITVGGIAFTKVFSWSVSFAGATGGTGGTGATGVSVTSVTPYFATVSPVGAAAPAIPVVSPPVAPWVATEPTYVANTELYRTERVLYSNATFQYTTVTKVSSYAAATAAMTSANGKNRTIYSTADASGTSFNGVPLIDGDTWYKYQTATTPQTVVAQWRFLTNAWVSQKVDGANLAYLDAGTITAGYLDVANRINAGSIHANKIQANTIRAQQMVLADTSNFCEINESFALPGTLYSETHVITAGWSTRASSAGNWFMFRDNQGPVPIKTGDRIRLVFEAYADAAVTASGYLWAYGTANVNQAFVPATFAITTTPTTFAAEMTVTVDMAAKQTFMVGLQGVAGRNVFVRNARCYTMNAGELVVDGTITTRHLAADSITAPLVAAGAITAEKIALGVLRRNNIFDGGFEDTYAFTDWAPWATGQGNTAQWRHVVDGATAGRGPVRDTSGLYTRSGSNAMLLYAGAGEVATAISNTFPTVVGKTYRLVVNATSLTSPATLALDMQVADTVAGIDGFNSVTLTGDTSWVTTVGMATPPIDSSEYTTYSWSFVATKAFAALRIGNNAPAAASTLVLDDISVVQTGIGGASELTSAGLRLFDDNGMEVTALVSNRSNRFSVSGPNGQTLAGITDVGGSSFQTTEVRGISDLVPVLASSLTSNVATIFTMRPHGYQAAPGETPDTVFISGLGAPFDGVATVTDTPTGTSFTFAKTAANVAYAIAPENATVNIGSTLSDGTSLRGLSIYGDDFIEWINQLPRGVLAWENFSSDITSVSTAEYGYGEIGFLAEPNRLYRVAIRSNVETNVTGGIPIIRVRMTYANAPAEAASPAITSPTLIFNRPNWQSDANEEYTYCDFAYLYNETTTPRNTRLLLTMESSATGTVTMYAPGSGASTFAAPEAGCVISVEDVGPYRAQGGAYNIGGAAVTAPLKSYTTTWTSTTAKTYMGTSGIPADSSQGEQDMKQGYSSYDGDSRSLWIFPSTLVSTMAGVTSDANITKVRIYLYANHWYYNSGGTALLKRHNYASAPASNPGMTTMATSTAWPKPGGRWVDVTNASGLKAALRGGTMRGIGVGPAGTTNLLYYGRFNKTGAKIEVTYKK